MPISGIQDQILEVTVVQCTNLKNTEFISKQDPYVYVEYGDAKFRTRTCTDGGRNPTFQEKFIFTLIEGRLEINVNVWNSNTLSLDDHIASGRISLLKVLSEEYDDCSWPLHCKGGRHAGDIKLILHYKKLNKHSNNEAMPAPSYPPPSAPPQAYSAYPVAYVQPPPSAYLPAGYWPYHTHPPPSYPPPPAYPPQPPVYHPPPYPPTTYPPATYPPAPYPPAPYPGQYPGAYPPY